MPTIHVLHDETETLLEVEHGANLRRELLRVDLSPYTPLTRVANCGGRGICATCGVWFEAGTPEAIHWHDKLAARFGYPRLSCQIEVTEDMTVQILDDKVIWGPRKAEKAQEYRQQQT